MENNKLYHGEVKAIGRNILRLVKERNTSVPKLAAKSQIDKGNLYRIINEGTGYSQASLDRIAVSLSCSLGELFSERRSELPAGMRRIPILDSKQVAAFTGGTLDIYAGAFPEFAMSCSTCSPQAFAYYIVGGSMIPDFYPGELIIVDPLQKPAPGQFVIAVADGEVVVRKYAQRGRLADGTEVFELMPSNLSFSNQRSDLHDLSIVGVARQRVLELP